MMWIFLWILFATNTVTRSANILVFAPLPFKSHFTGFQPLFKELGNRGHNITVVSQFPLKNPSANYTDIPINCEKNFSTGVNPIMYTNFNFLTMVIAYWKVTNIAEKVISLPRLQNFILSDDYKFDLVMIFSFCQEYGITLGHKYNAPVINLAVFMLLPSNSKWIGEPSTYSYIIDQRIGITDQMSFFERFKNTIVGMLQLFAEDYFYIPVQKEIMNKYFKYKGHESRPPIEDMLKNVSLTLINSHHSVGISRPHLPGSVEIAGLHINEPKPLSGKFLEFIESAKDGVILFSFGTVVDSSKLPNTTLEVFINVFKKLKQKVIWKLNSTDFPQLPTHIMVDNWLPQSDILGHPNVRLFITHGGLHSIEEATYNVLPIIGIPFFGDQYMNMKLAERNGIGKMLNIHSLNEKSLLWTINEILTNPKYKENSKIRSEMYKDQQTRPMDRAVYWVEYVLRHNGASHLRSNDATLNFTEHFLIDVCFVIFWFTIICVFLFVKIIKYLVEIKNRQTKKYN